MTEQAVDMEIPKETFTHDIKKSYLQHYFFLFRVFFSNVSAATPISGFSLWWFRFVVFLCKRDCSASRAGEEEMTEIRVVSRETNLILHIETYQL